MYQRLYFSLYIGII